MSFSIITGTPGVYDPSGAYIDSGWVIAGGYATHYPCNPGTMNYIGEVGLVVGRTYTVTYTVDNYVSGTVSVSLGSEDGIGRTANGTYTETLVCNSNTGFKFYSDGYLRVSKIQIYDTVIGTLPGITSVFYDGDNKRWGLTFSAVPEYSVRFKNALYMFKDGAAWLNGVNEVRNNFFGVQYFAQIKFIANFGPTTEKTYFSMRVESNRCWYAQEQGDIYLPPMEGKSQGMQSRLRKNRFRKLQGSYFADFLRNMLTPDISTPEIALFTGAQLQGQYMEITLTCKETIDVTLVEIDVKTALSQYTY